MGFCEAISYRKQQNRVNLRQAPMCIGPNSSTVTRLLHRAAHVNTRVLFSPVDKYLTYQEIRNWYNLIGIMHLQLKGSSRFFNKY